MTVHVFDVDDAVKYGVEKAVILQNMRFWLDKNKANGTNLHDGYYWTYNSAEAFYKLLPYFKSAKVIQRLLKSMVAEGLLLAGNYNKKGYDRTKWYSMPEYCAESLDTSHCSKMTNGLDKNDQCNGQECPMDCSEMTNAMVKNDQPIPDINTDSKPDVNADTNASVDNDSSSWIDESFEEFYKSYPNKKGKGQAEKTWNNVFTGKGSHKKPSNPFDLFETIMSAVKAQTPIILASEPRYRKHPSTWLNAKAWLDEVDQPPVNHQSSNQNTYQGNTHASNQSANNKPRRETTEEYKQRMQREFNQEFGIEVQPGSHTDCYS